MIFGDLLEQSIAVFVQPFWSETSATILWVLERNIVRFVEESREAKKARFIYGDSSENGFPDHRSSLHVFWSHRPNYSDVQS